MPTKAIDTSLSKANKHHRSDAEIAKHYKIPKRAVELMRILPNPNYTWIPGKVETCEKFYDPFALARHTDYIDISRGEEFIDLFNTHIKIPDGDMAGQPMICPPWFEAILLNTYSWYQEDGYRRFNEEFIYVPKKNNKTSGVAGWAAVEFRWYANHGAQFYSAAANREQAGLLYKAWANMIALDDVLAEGTQVLGGIAAGGIKSIVMEQSSKSYKPLSRDANTGDGVGPDFLVGDEIHRHPDGELMSVLKKSQSAKRNSISIETTTADYDRPSLCNRMVARARLVCNNTGDPSMPGYQPRFLPAIYEVHPEYYKKFPDCWKDIEVWKRVNPNWGITVHEDNVRQEIQKCIDDPSELNETLRLNLNIVTEQSEIWMPMDKYDVCAATRDDSELYGVRCYGGMDLSTTQDLTSFCLAWKHPEGGYDVRWWFWIPGDKLMDREKKDGVPYRVWANDDWLELIPGEVIDQEYVKQRVMEICGQYRVVTIGADKFNNTWIMQELDRNKINVQPFAQNAGTITEPAKELMTRVIEGKFRHGCNPVARWNFSNAVIKKFPNDTFRLDKDKAEKRIDGVAAAIMAVGCSMQDIKIESVYARYGVLSGSG